MCTLTEETCDNTDCKIHGKYGEIDGKLFDTMIECARKFSERTGAEITILVKDPVVGPEPMIAEFSRKN